MQKIMSVKAKSITGGDQGPLKVCGSFMTLDALSLAMGMLILKYSDTKQEKKKT